MSGTSTDMGHFHRTTQQRTHLWQYDIQGSPYSISTNTEKHSALFNRGAKSRHYTLFTCMASFVDSCICKKRKQLSVDNHRAWCCIQRTLVVLQCVFV